MGLLRGRHAQVMSPRELERGKRKKDLPDVYVGSAEWEVEFHDPNFDALLDVKTGLPESVKREIERGEGLRAPVPLSDCAPPES